VLYHAGTRLDALFAEAVSAQQMGRIVRSLRENEIQDFGPISVTCRRQPAVKVADLEVPIGSVDFAAGTFLVTVANAETKDIRAVSRREVPNLHALAALIPFLRKHTLAELARLFPAAE